MAHMSWTDVPASAVRVGRPLPSRGKPVMAARLGNFPSSAHPRPRPVAVKGGIYTGTEKTVPEMDSESIGSFGRGGTVELRSTDFLVSGSLGTGAVSKGVGSREILLPTKGFGEVPLGTSSSVQGSIRETSAFPHSCLPVHTSAPSSALDPLGVSDDIPLREPVPPTARLCGANSQSGPAIDPPLTDLTSPPLATDVPSSSSVSGGDWSTCPLAVPANAFRLQLSLPELLSTLPHVSMETNEPFSKTSDIETSDGNEAYTSASRPYLVGSLVADRSHVPTCKRRRVAASFPNRLPSTAFKVGPPTTSDRALLPTVDGTEECAKMVVDIPPPPCVRGTSNEASLEGANDSSVTRQSLPTTKSVSRLRTSRCTVGKEMEGSSMSLHRRKRGQGGKRQRLRGGSRAQEDSVVESPSPPVDDASFLFAMDVEGLLLEEEAKRKCTRKCKKLSTDTSSSCELTEEEVDTKTARKKRKELSRKKRGKKGEKPKKPTPNAFVSVRIPSPQIRENIEQVQKSMLLSDKKLKSALVSLDKLHLTLMVLRLEGDEAVERAKDALQASVEGLRAQPGLLTDPVVLELSGVGSFGRGVVFAEIQGGEGQERLSRIAETVRSVFDSHGFPTTDPRPFNPHLTIAKISRAGRKGPRQIEKETYSDFRDAIFGSEEVTGLELLSMTEPAAEDGYYHCFGRCGFNDS